MSNLIDSSQPKPDNVDWRLVVRLFCNIYLKNKDLANAWAKKHIPVHVFPKIRDQVKVELKRRGVILKDKT